MGGDDPFDPEIDDDQDGQIAIADDATDVARPPKYAVLLHNDDYTTMEFVIEVLSKFFRKTSEEAARIMLSVHHTGKGVAGIFDLEIAETKVAQVTSYARAHGYPLKCTAEPLED